MSGDGLNRVAAPGPLEGARGAWTMLWWAALACDPAARLPESAPSGPSIDSMSGAVPRDSGELLELTDALPLERSLPISVEPLVIGEPARITAANVYGGAALVFRGSLLRDTPGATPRAPSCPALAGGCLDIADAELIGRIGPNPGSLLWWVPSTESVGTHIAFQLTSGSRKSAPLARRVSEQWPPVGGWVDPLEPDPGGQSYDDPVAVESGHWMDLYLEGSDHFVFELQEAQVLRVVVEGASGGHRDADFEMSDFDSRCSSEVFARYEWQLWSKAAQTVTLALDTEYGSAWGPYSLLVSID